MRVALFAVLCLSVLALPAAAQTGGILSGTFSQNPIVQGQNASLVVEATQTTSLATGCGLTSVHQGSPTGPIVFQPFFCPAIFITVGPNAPFTIGWGGTDNFGNQVAPGTYYIKVDGSTNIGTPTTSFFPIRIDAPGTPTLPVLSMNGGGPIIGGSVTFDISNGDPGGSYVMLASFTTNVGSAPAGVTGRLDLDQDLLFGLSFPVPHPSFFANWFGGLDGAGASSPMAQPTFTVPAITPTTGLIDFPMAFQAAIIGASGVTMTNTISATLN